LLRERIEPGIEVLRLNRPQQRNALDSPTLRLLVEALDELAGDGALRVVVFSTTSERALCAGADTSERLDRAGGIARMEAFARLYAGIEACPVPTVCVCVGNCVGAGAELVAGCDLRIGGSNLKLAWVGGRLGVPVGVARLVPLVGLSRAKELIFSGRTLDAAEADALGLLTRVAAGEQAEASALELAGELAALPPDGLRRLKASFRALEDSAARVARENDVLIEWQRHGAGLPAGSAEPA
jgi:enoyl-CoA hydratase/carnithine racemase